MKVSFTTDNSSPSPVCDFSNVISAKVHGLYEATNMVVLQEHEHTQRGSTILSTSFPLEKASRGDGRYSNACWYLGEVDDMD